MPGLAVRKAYRSFFRRERPPIPLTLRLRFAPGGLYLDENVASFSNLLSAMHEVGNGQHALISMLCGVKSYGKDDAVRGRLFLLDSHRRKAGAPVHGKTSVTKTVCKPRVYGMRGFSIVHAPDSEG